VRRAVADAHRREWAFVLAATARVAGDIDLAEECVQDAYVAALDTWTRDGVPSNPGAWLTVAARRKALDAHRRDRTLRTKLPLLVDEPMPAADVAADFATDYATDYATDFATDEESGAVAGRGNRESGAVAGRGNRESGDIAGRGFWESEAIPDDRLRLVFTCCHPALAREAQVALTLRLVCGLTTAEIAQAFLVPEATMAARMTRAKKKIAAARIAYRVPAPAELPDRLDAVLTVVHLLYTTGHSAPSGSSLVRADVLDRSMELTRLLARLMPDEREVRGLLALLLLTDARRATRTGPDGRMLLLEEQDRSTWDRQAIAEGLDLVVGALRGGRPGRFALQAAIAGLHAEAPSFAETDWPQLLQLYNELLRVWPSPVIALNRTVVVSMVDGPAAALDDVAALERGGRLDNYRYLAATKADLLRRLGRTSEAAQAYRRALTLADNAQERDFLTRRLTDLT
jgi:RNA polymerase sigma-70 factor (ECF subfamily)